MSTRQPELFDAVDAAAEQARSAERSAHITARFAKMRVEREAKWAATSDEELLRMRVEASVGDTDATTKMCLGLAVPIWIDRMRYWRPDYRVQVAHDLVEIIAFDQGVAAMVDRDAMLSSKRRRPGELGKAFNAVAQGLACLAFCPGGIVFAGCHWEVTTEVKREGAP